jgi:CubicO group peptidase (beta-lactamase class C family)
MIDRRNFMLGTAAALLLPASAARAAIAESRIDALLKRHAVPGVSIAVIEDGAVAWAEAYGMAQILNRGNPTTTTHRFQAASLSKTLNALVILRLVDNGQLDLDTPVNDYLESWQLGGDYADRVTIAHLMSHTGATTVHGFGGYDHGASLPATADILNGYGNSPVVINEGRPGRTYKYSGGGTTVLQQLVEDVTGLDYSVAAQNLALDPLGMTNSSMRPATSDNATIYAHAHGQSGKRFGTVFHDYPEIAAAGLWTTPSDMALALLAIASSYNGDGGSFLSRSLARRMLKPIAKDAALGTFANGSRFYHSGSNFGFRCAYLGNAASRSGYVVMTNGENGSELVDDIVPLIRQERGW